MWGGKMLNKKGQLKKIGIISIFAIILLGVFVLAFPQITQIFPTTSPYVTSDDTVNLSFGIDTNGEGLSDITFSWNGTNYTIYDTDNLVLAYNFNNLSALGENDTHIFDISGHGNNGTVKFLGNVTWNSSGKYDGAFDFGGNEDNGHIESEDFVDLFNETGFTASGWFYPKAYKGDSEWNVAMSKFDGGSNGFELRWSDSASEDGFKFQMIQSGSYAGMCVVTQSTQDLNQWYYIAIVFNATAQTCKLYTDGELIGTDSSMIGGIIGGDGVGNNLQIGRHAPYGRNFNGSVDEVRLWNISLSDNEIRQQYYSNLKKFDYDSWSLYINQSNLTTNNPGINYDYFSCATDSSDAENCTSTQTITIVPIAVITTANFTSTIGNVRSDFYGVNIQNPNWMIGGYNYDTDCDGVNDISGNTSLNKEEFLNGGFSSMRLDYYFDSYYDGLNNFGFEDWNNNVSAGNLTTSGGTGVRGWTAHIGGGGGRWVNFTKSTDAHSGSYALQANASSVSGNQYMSGDNFYGVLGENYTFSVWLKGSGSVILHFWDASFVGKASKVVTLTGSYVQSNISWVNNIGNATYYFGMDFTPNVNVTLDDYDLYDNGTKVRWWSKGDTSNLEEQILWNYENDIRPLVIFWSNLPTFLANWSSPNCFSNSTGDNSCPPYDYDIANNISLDAIKRITNENEGIENNIDLEFKNEPYGTHSGACDYDSITCALDYVNFYEQTYDTIKAYNSNIAMGGPSGYKMSITPNILTTFFTNVSNKFDFVTFHPYSGSFTTSNQMYVDFYNLINNCTSLGGGSGCNRIINSEWQPTSSTMNESLGQSSWYKSNIAMAYLPILNYVPNNASLHYYHWKDTQSYFSCPSRYSYYPTLYSGISDKGMDNPTATYYPPYNVTKNFAHLCQAGATVYQSSSDDSTIKVVSCKKGNQNSVIVINTDTEAKNVTLNTSNYLTKINNYETGAVYSSSTGVFELGIMDSYDILYLTYGDETGSGKSLWLKLSEMIGTIAYDFSGNGNNGTISGATWRNDGILNTLISGVDYSLNNNIFTILNDEFSWSQLLIDYDVVTVSEEKSAVDNLVSQFLLYPALIGLLGTIIFLGLIIFLLFKFKT